MRTHLLIVLGLVLVTGAVYSRLAVSNFCGFDDALELQRMSFQDPGTLAADMGTVLFNSYKYRPGMMTLNRITFRAGDRQAWAFRIRNVACHVLITATLYGVGILLFDSIPVAAIAALFFGLNPIMNQAVAGAVWVIAPANLCLILSFFLFLISLRAPRGNILALAASILVGSVGVLIYDPVIVVYGLIYLYLFVWLFLKRRKLPGTGYLVALLALTVAFLGIWFSLRARFLPHGTQHPAALSIFIRNLAIYMAAPFQFVDPVFSNRVFDTPLPSEAIRGEITPEFLAIAIIPPILFLWIIVSRVRFLKANLTRNDFANFAFLILAWGGSVLPYLVYNEHPSETYNYVGFMMVMLIFSRLLHAGFLENGSRAGRRIYAAIVASIAILYIPAVIVKNNAVHGCGATFARILSTLPDEKLRSGAWDIQFADVQESQPRACMACTATKELKRSASAIMAPLGSRPRFSMRFAIPISRHRLSPRIVWRPRAIQASLDACASGSIPTAKSSPPFPGIPRQRGLD